MPHFSLYLFERGFYKCHPLSGSLNLNIAYFNYMINTFRNKLRSFRGRSCQDIIYPTEIVLILRRRRWLSPRLHSIVTWCTSSTIPHSLQTGDSTFRITYAHQLFNGMWSKRRRRAIVKAFLLAKQKSWLHNRKATNVSAYSFIILEWLIWTILYIFL